MIVLCTIMVPAPKLVSLKKRKKEGKIDATAATLGKQL